MRTLAAIAHTGLTAVLLHPLRSSATLFCLVALLAPYVAGAAVARGVEAQVDATIRGGAELHVAGRRFGRPAAVPAEAAAALRAVPGVRTVTPRVVGEIALGRERLDAIVVGLPAAILPPAAACVEGTLFAPGASHELVLGADLARRLGLSVGAVLPPFYRNPAGEKVARVVGLFRADQPYWSGNLVFCSLETAQAIFAQDGLVTGFLVECAPGYRQAVKRAVLRLPALAVDAHGPVAAAATTRADLRALLPRSLRHLAGLWHLFFVVAFAVGIPLLMVAAGLGLSERRREAALLRATGWRTDELILRGLVESLVLAAIGAALAILVAWCWLVVFDGRGLAGLFLPGAPSRPAFDLPFALTPLPALLGFAVSLGIVATGTLYSTWRAATAHPAHALR